MAEGVRYILHEASRAKKNAQVAILHFFAFGTTLFFKSVMQYFSHTLPKYRCTMELKIVIVLQPRTILSECGCALSRQLK